MGAFDGFLPPLAAIGILGGAILSIAAVLEENQEQAEEASAQDAVVLRAAHRFGRLDSHLGPGQVVEGKEYLAIGGMSVDEGVGAILKRYDINRDGVVNLATMESHGIGQDGELRTPMVNPWGNYREEFPLFSYADHDRNERVTAAELRGVLGKEGLALDEEIDSRMVWETSISFSDADREAARNVSESYRERLIYRAADNKRMDDPLNGSTAQNDAEGSDVTLAGKRTGKQIAEYVLSRYDRDGDGAINLKTGEDIGVDSSGKLRTLYSSMKGEGLWLLDSDWNEVVTRSELIENASRWGFSGSSMDDVFEVAVTLTKDDLQRQDLYGHK